MFDKIKIIWLGHSCFKIEYGGHSIVLDPYENVDGYPELSVSAGAVHASHGHDDHGCIQAVTLEKEEGNSPFKLTEIPCFHDSEGGALRGTNLITVIEVAGKRIAHFGDLGHMLSGEQIAAVGRCDVIMLPVGGFYTIDARGARQVVEDTDPTVVIPMHYRNGKYGFDVIAEVDEFLDLCADREIISMDSNTYEVDDSEKRRVVVLKFAK